MEQNKHSASAPLAGYYYQFERALWHLATKYNISYVGIETLDDITVHDSNNNSILEQDKYSQSDCTSRISLKSEALWKTLHIWLSQVNEGEIAPEKTAFHLVTNTTSLPQTLAPLFPEEPRDKIDDFLEKLKDAAQKPGEKIKGHVEYVLKDEYRDNFLAILRRTEVFANAKRATLREDIKSALNLSEDLHEHADHIVDSLMGWLSNLVMQRWESGQQALIARQSYCNQYQIIIKGLRIDKRSFRSARRVHLDSGYEEQESNRMYVKQLNLINATHTRIIHAIEDKLRTQKEKLRVAEIGTVLESEWEDFDFDLTQEWERIKDKIANEAGSDDDPRRIGLGIYDEAMAMKANFAGAPVSQDYITKGEFHHLADGLKVGWHPDYKEKLQ